MAQLWGHAATSLDGYVVCIGLSHSLTLTCQGSAQFSASPRQLPPLKADIKETGLEAHHLIEQRFAGVMGQKASGMASIAVTDTEHQAFTNAWRKAIPYGPDGTGMATRMEVETSAPQIYAGYPDIQKAVGLLMSEFVQLYWKRNRGWPSPEDSWGLGPMFGDDGSCRSCGTPLREQCGPLTLRLTGLSPLAGGWVPNWRFDALCLEGSVAKKVVAEGFSVDLREVAWHGSSPGTAFQIVAPSVGLAWFDPEELRARAEDRHGVAGATCADCGTWRWMPMTHSLLPPVAGDVLSAAQDVIASPEWFGDGCQSYRQVLVRRRLGELIAAASPRDFKVQQVT